MKNINKNRTIQQNKEIAREIHANSNTKNEYQYSNTRGFIDYNKRRKIQKEFSEAINLVDSKKKLPF